VRYFDRTFCPTRKRWTRQGVNGLAYFDGGGQEGKGFAALTSETHQCKAVSVEGRSMNGKKRTMMPKGEE
jgi:hypothetical protein